MPNSMMIHKGSLEMISDVYPQLDLLIFCTPQGFAFLDISHIPSMGKETHLTPSAFGGTRIQLS